MAVEVFANVPLWALFLIGLGIVLILWIFIKFAVKIFLFLLVFVLILVGLDVIGVFNWIQEQVASLL